MTEVFETADLAAAEQVLSRNYGSLRISAHGQRRGMRLTHACLTPAVHLDKVSFAMSIDAYAAPLGVLVFNDLKAGSVRHGCRDGDRYYRAGQVYLAGQPDRPYAVTIQAAETEMAVMDPWLPVRRPVPSGLRRHPRPHPQPAMTRSWFWWDG